MAKHERASRAMQESMMTKDEVQAWANETLATTGRWPGRRWRVEGSRGGTSRLVTNAKAKVLVAQHGGVIVEMVGKRPKDTKPRISKNADRAIGMVKCPLVKCGAEEDQVCRSGETRKECKPHKLRVIATDAVRKARNAALVAQVSASPPTS
jgi:hypothetical protein